MGSEPYNQIKQNKCSTFLRGWPNYCDDYCQCVHDGTCYDPYDTFAGVGIEAYYDPNQVAYDGALWIFDDGTGGSGQYHYCTYGPQEVDACTNVNQGMEYYNYATATRQTYSGDDAWWVILNTGGPNTLSPDVSSVEGETLAGFNDPNNPTHIWYIESFTSPWNIMTAFHS
jgi:hypothetical protein